MCLAYHTDQQKEFSEFEGKAHKAYENMHMGIMSAREPDKSQVKKRQKIITFCDLDHTTSAEEKSWKFYHNPLQIFTNLAYTSPT